MPVLNDPNMVQGSIPGSHYGFSSTRIEDLGASEYTLVVIAADASGSVSPYRDEIEACVQEILRSCQLSPRADNLMLRLLTFDSRLTEIHGFKPLSTCQVDDYAGSIVIGGSTALHDAAHDAVESTTLYARELADHGLDVNAIVFVITDGGDNASKMKARHVRKAVERALTSEAVESMLTVLVGVGADAGDLSTYLRGFQKETGFTVHVDLGSATAASLARLASFVSTSIASQSRALGTGSAARLTF